MPWPAVSAAAHDPCSPVAQPPASRSVLPKTTCSQARTMHGHRLFPRPTYHEPNDISNPSETPHTSLESIDILQVLPHPPRRRKSKAVACTLSYPSRPRAGPHRRSAPTTTTTSQPTPRTKGNMLASATLLALAALASADGGPAAIPKLSADYNAKLFPEHLAFIAAQDASPAPVPGNNASLGDGVSPAGYAPRLFERAFAAHFDSSESQRDVLRRAAEALRLLEKRSGCPAGMNSCASVGSPNKCCQDGTYCTDVSDTMVGHVACCPEGSTCDGAVSQCPSTAVSCPPSLGGGCCLEGYECAGVGCMSSLSLSLCKVHSLTRYQAGPPSHPTCRRQPRPPAGRRQKPPPQPPARPNPPPPRSSPPRPSLPPLWQAACPSAPPTRRASPRQQTPRQAVRPPTLPST